MKIGLIVKIDEKKATKGWLMAEEYHVVISNLNELSAHGMSAKKRKISFGLSHIRNLYELITDRFAFVLSGRT